MNLQSTNTDDCGAKKLKPFFSYQLLLVVLIPLTLWITIRDGIRRKGGLRFIKQRFGFNYRSHKNQAIWLHAASVGEVNAALPLLAEIKKQYPLTPLIISTATATAARTLKKLHPFLEHHFLPLDYKIAVNRFLNHIQPKLALIMETELWPNLFYQCSRRDIPIIIINARLSDKTLDCNQWQRRLYHRCLQQCSLILARSPLDENRFEQLGAESGKLKTIGNLKFSAHAPPSNQQQPIKLPKPYIIAASTHNNEEARLCQCWQQLGRKDLLLVIAPRHPERRNAIIKLLRNLPLEFAVRSKGDSVTQSTDIYLADTMGELNLFMQSAELVFIGGSLIPHGGQNILEPASLGKAIITGPYMHNFADEIRLFKENDAIVQVQNEQQLCQQLAQLLSDSPRRKQLGQTAMNLIQQQQNNAKRYLNELLPYLNSCANSSAQDE